MKRRDVAKRSRKIPRIETLEGRLLLYSASGGEWSHPERITFSFAPDGTDIGGTPSSLFSTLNSKFATSTWQDQFRRAAAVWEAVSNINLVQVSDSGAGFGSTGDQQGDTDFGDIRIGGLPQSSNTLAFAYLPPPFNGGTAAGDIFLNTNQSWQINSDYDVLTVAIHEFGHALGMSHSAITSADMYAYYNGVKQSLTSDDVSGIQSVYSTRQPDPFDSPSNNNAASAATSITPYINGLGQVTISGLDIQNTNDFDFFKVTVPSSTTGTMNVTVQSSNLSLLSPRVQVYNSSLSSLAFQAAVGAYGATVGVSIGGVSPGQVYYIRASAAGSGVTGAGGYGLLVNFGSSYQAPVNPPNTTVASQPNQGGGASASSVYDPRAALLHPLVDLGQMITIGSLTGQGDSLDVAEVFRHRHKAHPGSHRPATSGTDPGHLVAPIVPTLTSASHVDSALGEIAREDLFHSHLKARPSRGSRPHRR